MIANTSCKKDSLEPIKTEVNPPVANQREDVTYPSKVSSVDSDNEFVNIVVQSTDYLNSSSTHQMEPNNSFLVEYENSSKKIVVVPIVVDNNKIQFYYIAKVVDSAIEGSGQFVKFTSSEEYKNLLGTNPIFYNNAEIPYSGTMEIFNLQEQPVTTTTFQEKRQFAWTPHGGYPSWTDCFEHYSGTYWGIIGYVVAPGAMLIGIAAGCM